MAATKAKTLTLRIDPPLKVTITSWAAFKRWMRQVW